jgi:hypothetical protein
MVSHAKRKSCGETSVILGILCIKGTKCSQRVMEVPCMFVCTFVMGIDQLILIEVGIPFSK